MRLLQVLLSAEGTSYFGNKDEFKYNSPHRYSVIVQEYFHIYQMSLSKDRMDPKWLAEGGAKVIEEMFVQQYYGRSSLEGDLKRRSLWSDEVFTDPNLYEKYETQIGMYE